MKAVLIEEPHRVGVKRIDDPSPGGGEIVVKVEACGICGTDIHVLEGDFAPTRYPIVPGHEFCGETVAVGPDVSNVRVGDFVAVDPSLFCGSCYFCQLGRDNLCENFNALGVGSAFGACAEYVSAPSKNAYALPDDLPRRWGTLVEPLSCAVHGFDQLDLRLASSYLIYGAGTMGLMLAQLAARTGAKTVDMVDLNPGRFDLARRLAADRVAASADDLDEPRGWDVVIDATGAVPAIEDGLRRVKRGGTFLVFGVAAGDAVARFSPFKVYNDEINIVGSMAVLHSFERARDLLV
ncbi:MAG: zinc-dependent alcohol dehydrogenase family protein, partial [Candidatus Dormibacteraeota bacterium]|nr:zinc-dependent alcohol dehydrogenase family protein [Candidatus Dormibacteraeota bacterium]